MHPSAVRDTPASNTIAPSVLERVVRHDRALVAFALGAITIASWMYLVRMAAMMNAAAADKAMHAAMGMPEMAAWGRAEFLMLFVMWTVMMVAMMLPSAAPVILLVVGTYRRRGARPTVLTASFTTGYLLAWTAFSAIAAGTQLILHRAAMLSPGMSSSSTRLGGAILIGAGVYQWLPIKGACLTQCRSPLGFLTREWREGTAGALIMGVRHGAFCVGCCWALMALLFVAGVMNLISVAAIAVFVLIEKLAPVGGRFGRAAGLLLASWGAWLLIVGAGTR
jgi:predicted metal-binding membrane protein